MSSDKQIETTENLLTPEELQNPSLSIPVDTAELEAEEKIMEGVEDIVDDLNKKNYIKITPTLYIRPVLGEDNKDLYLILNPETSVVEKRELTDDEKYEILVQELKLKNKKFNPLSHPIKITSISRTKNKIGRTVIEKEREYVTNVTVNQFDTDYKKKRQRKNKMAKASRRANRKK